MLQRLTVRGFRGLRDLSIEFSPGAPLVLIGPNGSGKSTILDALDFIGSLARGEWTDAWRRRGGLPAVNWRGRQCDIEFEALFTNEGGSIFEADGGPVEYYLRITDNHHQPSAAHEEVRIYKRGLDEKPFVAMRSRGLERWSANVATKTKEVVVTESQEPPEVGRDAMRTPAEVLLPLAGADGSRYPTPQHVCSALSSIEVYPGFRFNAPWKTPADEASLQPSAIAEIVERIDRRGTNLLNALHTLQSRHREAWFELLRDVRAGFPWCTDVRFQTAPGRGRQELLWTDSRTGKAMYLDEMSDGMLAYLGLLAALYAQDDPGALAFDEPDHHLHPQLLRRFVAALEVRATRTPTIVTTHADRFLDFLEQPASSLRIASFDDERGTRLESMDREALGEWIQDYRLSDLRAQGQLDNVSQDAPDGTEEPESAVARDEPHG